MRESRILIRHFFARFSDNESLSARADPAANLGPTLGLLATPGAFLVILLQTLTLRGWDLVFFRSFFLSYSMIVMAFLTVLKWDALFPDLRDYQILTPLPLRTWQFLLTKMVALGIFLGLFLVDLNLFGTLFWPGLDQRHDDFAIMRAHVLAMFAGGLFAALATATLQGVLMNLLPLSAFLRVRTWIQTALMALLVMLLFLTPMLAMSLRTLVHTGHPLLQWFPGFWFIGLYEQLRPATRDRVLFDLGERGWQALAGVTVLFVLTYLPGYRRHARLVVESPPSNPRGPGVLARAASALLDRWVLRTPVERAVFHFIGQTITRSLKHRIFLAAYGGFGAALGVMSYASGPDGLLRLPLTLTFVLISGLRAAFNFPSDLRANWAFQLTETESPTAYLRALRKWVVMCTVLPLLCAIAPFEFLCFRWTTALFHLAFGFTLALLLIEVMFFGFRKAPFTCAYFPGRINLVGLSVIYLLGFTMYSDAMAQLEAFLTGDLAAESIFFGIAGAGLTFFAWWRRRVPEEPVTLDYQGEADPAVRTLGLASR